MFVAGLLISFLFLFEIKFSEQASCVYDYVDKGAHTWNNGASGEGGCNSNTSPAGFCDGMANSPIDLPYNGVSIKRDWLPFQLLHYSRHPYKMYLANNGHTAVVTFDTATCYDIPTVIQGGLPGNFELAQFHFHWGSSTGSKGSEHTMFGNQFDAELHLVHYNTKCGRSLGEAIANCAGHDAAAVLGVFIEMGGNDNHGYDPVINNLASIREKGASVEIDPFDMSKLFPHDMDEFYRYQGGLTTPGCNEIVTWTVFKNHVKISKKQMAEFWALTTPDGSSDGTTPIPLIDNFRPPQALNGRTIYYADLKLRCKHRDWTKSMSSTCDIYYKETDDELGFMEAVHSCIGYHYGKTPYQGLIPIGRLRCLRNRFKDSSGDDICGRFFRVNAIKDDMGVWREHPSGKRVSFSHYPEFNPLHGGEGDTLVWDAFLNRLFVQDEHDHYNALCYRDYQDKCDQCMGLDEGSKCSDNGDCMNNQCMCDEDFSEHDCHLGPVPDKEVVMVGGSTTTSGSSSVYTLPGYQDSSMYSETANYPYGTKFCGVASYNEASGTTTGQVCDFVFNRGICCNGMDSSNDPVDTCHHYDCFTNGWTAIESMPAKLKNHASNKHLSKGRDYMWMVGGGRDDSDAKSKKLYAMDMTLKWATVNSELPEEREKHCQVQINDCEIAFIGGIRGANYDGYVDGNQDLNYDSSTDDDDVIDIYNHQTNTWRTGPKLAHRVYYATCAMLPHYSLNKYSNMVVIGCGGKIQHQYTSSYSASPNVSTTTYGQLSPSALPKVQVWDLSSNKIKEMTEDMYKCPEVDNDTDMWPSVSVSDVTSTSYNESHTSSVDGTDDQPNNENGKFKELDDTHLVYTNAQGSSHGEVHFFTMENGFHRGDNTAVAVTLSDGAVSYNHHGGDSFVAPRGATVCV